MSHAAHIRPIRIRPAHKRRAHKRVARRLVFVPLLALLWLSLGQGVSACGGLFCQNTPVDQVGERIVFSTDGETVTSLIEIQYFGEADDFSWILPIPEAIEADDLQVPENGDAVFDELHSFTDVRFIAPDEPDCVVEVMFDSATAESEESGDGGVDVFASGEVGPFGFDVIGSSDPNALIDWLVENGYRVEPEMEPLINVYVDDQFAFVAMRLLDGETSESIQPIEISYPGTKPMIPLRLTAVAAQNQMPIWTWVFADEQAVPENYSHMDIATEELTFSSFGGNDYISLVQNRADALGGQAFITEFATATENIGVTINHPYLAEKIDQYGYLTRLATYIDPAEMTVDPVFGFDGDRPDVSNVRDATGMTGLYDCEREGDSGGLISFGTTDAIDPTGGDDEVAATTPDASGSSNLLLFAMGGVIVVLVGVVGFLLGNRKPNAAA
ncbi:MAG: hypothetical protein ACI8TP_002395 [Acidimicrobiales bacterium]